jgi:hypothetical protein
VSDLADDVRRAFALLTAQPMQPHVPLLSPRCGLHGQHAECRSGICECECHAIDIDAYLEAKVAHLRAKRNQPPAGSGAGAGCG